MRKAVIRAGLETLYYSGVHVIARPLLAGAGAILVFHRVRPACPNAYLLNRLLEITPEFLDEVLGALRAADVDIIPMDKVRARIAGNSQRRFVALNFDDGYRDNLEYALPILKRHNAPFTVYVCPAFAEGRGELWWIAIEQAIEQHDRIEVELDGVKRGFDCSTAEMKRDTYAMLSRFMQSRTTDAELRGITRQIAHEYGVDTGKLCRDACMTWDEIATMAAEPLATIGAHTVTHPILTQLGIDAARAEMAGSASQIAAKLGHSPAHFAYPVGGPAAAGTREFALAAELGFDTAVTTRPGVLFADHAEHMTALPRISVNGEFQRLRYLNVLLSGAPTALMNRFRRVVAA